MSSVSVLLLKFHSAASPDDSDFDYLFGDDDDGVAPTTADA